MFKVRILYGIKGIRKILFLLPSSFFLCSAYAEMPAADADIVAEAVGFNLRDNRYNPEFPWYHGFQIGIGVPVAAPLPFASINGFVGHVNKEHRSFWRKRFGWRADFAFSSPLEVTGTFQGDDVVVSGKVFGFRRSERFEHGLELDFSDDVRDNIELNLDGINGRFAMKNQYLGGLIDFYPFGNTWFLGGLRFSGGYYFGSADIELRATIPDYFPDKQGYTIFLDEEIPDLYVSARMRPNSQVGGRLRWNYRGPYAGFGWDMGIWRGFKFYTDFGVVFANAPRMRDSDIIIPEDRFQACISGGGVACNPDNSDAWVNINIRNPEETFNGLLTNLFENFNGRIIGGVTINTTGNSGNIANDVSSWLNGNDTPQNAWITTMINANGGADFAGIINDIREQISFPETYDGDFDLSRLTQEYLDLRQDAVDDTNDALKDLKFVPMIRMGFMYRF